MKIVKTCADLASGCKSGVKLTEVKPGTVFRYGSHGCGPYLAVMGGFVDLSTNSYHSMTGTVGGYPVDNYKELSDAVIVLNEKP